MTNDIYSVRRRYNGKWECYYKVRFGPCGCSEINIPYAALEWNPEIDIVRKLKDYLRGNPMD